MAGSAKVTKTPNKNEILQLISEKFLSALENVSIRGIHGTFGTKEFTIIANIYNSEQEKNNVEKKKKKGVRSEIPAQEQSENKIEEKKEKAQEQELANPDKEPVQINKVEEKK